MRVSLGDPTGYNKKQIGKGRFICPLCGGRQIQSRFPPRHTHTPSQGGSTRIYCSDVCGLDSPCAIWTEVVHMWWSHILNKLEKQPLLRISEWVDGICAWFTLSCDGSKLYFPLTLRSCGRSRGLPLFSFQDPKNAKWFHSKYALKRVPSNGRYAQKQQFYCRNCQTITQNISCCCKGWRVNITSNHPYTKYKYFWTL